MLKPEEWEKKRLFFFFLCYLLTTRNLEVTQTATRRRAARPAPRSLAEPSELWDVKECLHASSTNKQMHKLQPPGFKKQQQNAPVWLHTHSAGIKCDVTNSQLSGKPFIPPVGVLPPFT